MKVGFPFLPVLRQLDKTPWGPANQQDSQFGDTTCTMIVVFTSLAGSDLETAGPISWYRQGKETNRIRALRKPTS